MNKIVKKHFYSENVVGLVVEAPLIARSRKAGHFVIIRVDDHSERVPLTIADADIENGTITLIAQRVGVSTRKLAELNEGDSLADVVGPLGKATDIRKFGTVICACGGVGAAPMLPIARALKQAGNKVITVTAARNKDLLLLKDQLREVSDELVVMTDDGSEGTKGLVTNGIETIIQREKVDKCITIGPAIMMKFVALLTKKYNIPTDASLNTIMVDGTGMCGACRVTVGGKTKFVCVDGPEFDAHEVDFDEMLKRLTTYRTEEKEAMDAYMAKENQNKEAEKNSENSTTELKAKDRVAIPRVKMPELEPQERRHLLRAEVNQGLALEQAMTEAKRCLNCAKPTCVEGCPVNINIPAFVKQIEKGNIQKAADIIHESSSLPAVCGRVCPQEKQCESKCIHLKMKSESVAIGYLERFAADYERTNNEQSEVAKPQTNGIKIAVIGSGPAGLTFAGDMAKWGYEVTVFEALHEIGGVLKYGIPEFRLPNKIVDHEIDGLRHLGVHFEKDVVVGKTITIEQLQEEGYKGIFVSTGAGFPRFMNIPGENLIGVLSSNEYLTRVNLMDASSPLTDTPILKAKRVAVIGGGNTAMDSVRTALRLGAEEATIVYRRSENEMPARVEEVKHAKEEGVQFLTLHNPIEYHADENGRVCRMTLQVMELGEPDASGRRSPVPVEGKTIDKDVDLVIVSIGVNPNPLIPNSMPELKTSSKGTIVVDDEMRSSMPVLFAGGDIVRGGATVILAMSDGRKAAAAMHKQIFNQ